jgi:mannose-1-phosphate guanylyltransferase
MQEINHAFAVIMAGGGGTRLWPLSRKKSPKQLLPVFDGKTLFGMAIERLNGLFSPENIIVVTIEEQSEILKLIAPQIPHNNYLIEPMPRGTAAVVAMAAAAISKRDPDGIMVVLTADHFIENVPVFHAVIKAACACAKTKKLVTLGIQPTFPSTGYGYIKIGESVESYGKFHALRAIQFEEKPDENRAIDYIKSGLYYWNSGMFIWQAAEILSELKKFMPDLATTIEEITPLVDVDHKNGQFIQNWERIKPQTIDYGIMEKTDHCVVFPVVDLGWNDVGSWDSMFDVLEPDENGNILLGGEIHPLESINSLVFSNDQSKLIIPLGIQNMIIVNTPDALLICPRGESQKVKILVEYLKSKQYTLFL